MGSPQVNVENLAPSGVQFTIATRAIFSTAQTKFILK